MSESTENSSPTSDRLPIEERSDRSLLRRLRRGEDDAATALYLRYAHRLRALDPMRAAL